jgi:hypothetical protein
MSTIGDLYRAQRQAQSGSAMYRVQPAAPPAPAPYERAAYGGLGDYLTERKPVADNRSDEAKRRASESPWGRAARQMAEDAVTDDAWAAHRAVMDGVGTGRGLISHADRTAYQQQALANRFGRIKPTGDLAGAASSPGQPTPTRIYASQLRQEEQNVHLAALRSSGNGLH